MNKQNTLVLILILVVSMFSMNGFASAQTQPSPQLQVGWQVVNNFTRQDQTDQNSQWIFGPQPEIEIFYANMTSIRENGYRVEAGMKLSINMTIPKSFMGVGNNLSKASFWGSSSADSSQSAFGLEYDVANGTWNAVSLHYDAGSKVPSRTGFLILYGNESTFSFDDDYYYIMFMVAFTNDAPSGIYYTGMQATDQEGRPISPSWLARVQSGAFETPPIGLGTEVNVGAYALPEYYYAEVVDAAGNVIHYAQAYDNITFQISANEPFGDVMVPFSLLTGDAKYKQTVSFSVPNDFNRLDTTWTAVTEMYPMLFFVYNGTAATSEVGYMADVSWSWIPAPVAQWAPSLHFELNNTIDLSEFWVETDTTIEHSGATISWTGHYTNSTDMNQADPYSKGGMITGQTYFWSVTDQKNQTMSPRPEIANLRTVNVAYEDVFMDGFVKSNGQIVRRAVPGEPLNVSMIVHAPAATVNGTVYIPMNETNVPVSGGPIDIAGAYVSTWRNNLTITLTTNGYGQNETMSWKVKMLNNLTMDLTTDQAWSNSSIDIVWYDSDSNFLGHYRATVNDVITVLGHSFEIGANETRIGFEIMFSQDAPNMKVDDVSLSSGVVRAWQMNVSLAGQNSWSLYPTVMNFTDPNVSSQEIQTYDSSRMIWHPANFIVGNYTLWQPQKWVVAPNGAIDLDGNVFTTNDQYFVKRTGFFESWGNTTLQGMVVGVLFDPTPGDPGDEFHSTSWMGVATMEIEFKANETFYWYHANGFTLLNSTEMGAVQDVLWADSTNGLPSPGYDWVSWLSLNRTIDLSKVTGLDQNYWKSSWFAWGTNQAFRVATSAASTTWAAFQAQYAGLLIYDDKDPDGAGPQQPNGAPDFSIVDGQVQTNEVTHVVLIDSIDSLALRRPFGATNDTGNVAVSPDTEVTFGISIYNVSVSIYPLKVENSNALRGPWAFRESYEGALGLNSTNFDYWISHATIDELSFDITFNVDMVEYNAADPTTWNHAVAFKVDQKIGTWHLEDFDNSVLENRSLAVNFFAVLGTGTRTVYSAGTQPVTDTNGASTSADYYKFGSANTPFANVSMGGLPYYWAGDGYSTEYTSGSSTAPVGAFSLMYQSDSGQSITQWKVDASMLFMTAGYTHWGGQEIRVDPVFVSYTNAQQTLPPQSTTTTTPPTSTTGPTSTPVIPNGGPIDPTLLMVAGLVIVAVMVCVLVRRRR